MTEVALVSSKDRGKAVGQAIDLLGVKAFHGKSVVLKPNFNTADPAPGSTHNDTLESLVRALQQMGTKQVTLAERSGPGDSTRKIM